MRGPLAQSAASDATRGCWRAVPVTGVRLCRGSRQTENWIGGLQTRRAEAQGIVYPRHRLVARYSARWRREDILRLPLDYFAYQFKTLTTFLDVRLDLGALGVFEPAVDVRRQCFEVRMRTCRRIFRHELLAVTTRCRKVRSRGSCRRPDTVQFASRRRRAPPERTNDTTTGTKTVSQTKSACPLLSDQLDKIRESRGRASSRARPQLHPRFAWTDVFGFLREVVRFSSARRLSNYQGAFLLVIWRPLWQPPRKQPRSRRCRTPAN